MKAMFYVLIAVSTLSALAVLLTRNVLHAALWLIVCLLAIAGIYLILHAEFLAVTQIIIYAGGVVVLVLFGVMLTSRLSQKGKGGLHQNLLAGAVISSGLLGVLCYTIIKMQPTPVLETMDMSRHVKSVGIFMFTDYAAPFEITGLLLLVSLIIAAVIASQLKQNQ